MKLLSTVILYFLALGVAGYAVVVYVLLPLGEAVHPDMRATFLAHKSAVYTHIFASSVALALGPFQFSSRLRQKYSEFHRWLGRAYLGIGVLFGGLAGLYMSVFAFGGAAGRLGFACLALAWLFTGAMAFKSIRGGAVADHRKWMVRNFALTFAAVTLRIYLPVGMLSGIPFEASYPFIAWLCWIPNVLFAEWLFNRAPNNSFKPTPLRGST
ncbi:MAG: hypothetical protein RLZZ385_356 [Pseudomonadota bacterium]|jgi:uncharacterized membrane protein